MDIKVITVLLGLSFLPTTMYGEDHHKHVKYTPDEYFKNYALSVCVSNGYSSKDIVEDAAAAARGYLELGRLPLEAHTEANLLAKKFLAREYQSISGEKLILMKCIDFYHSKEIKQLVRKYQRVDKR
jgi:hypothetical protein